MREVAAPAPLVSASTVDDAIAGSETAFARLISEHHPSMIRVAYVITGDMLDGRVLIEHAGDNNTRFGDFAAVPVALDVFDPNTNTFSRHEPGNWPGPPTVTQLKDGRLLLTGLEHQNGKTWAATYDIQTGVLTDQPETSRAIFPQGATTSDGHTVLVGGYTDPPPALGNPAVPWTDIFQ